MESDLMLAMYIAEPNYKYTCVCVGSSMRFFIWGHAELQNLHNVHACVLLTNAPLDKVTECVVIFFKLDDDDKDDDKDEDVEEDDEDDDNDDKDEDDEYDLFVVLGADGGAGCVWLFGTNKNDKNDDDDDDKHEDDEDVCLSVSVVGGWDSRDGG